MTTPDPIETAEAFNASAVTTHQAAVVAYAAALAELLCDFDIVEVTGPDDFTPATVAEHRSCRWTSRPVHQTCLGLIIDDAMEHLQVVHSGR